MQTTASKRRIAIAPMLLGGAALAIAGCTSSTEARPILEVGRAGEPFELLQDGDTLDIQLGYAGGYVLYSRIRAHGIRCDREEPYCFYDSRLAMEGREPEELRSPFIGEEVGSRIIEGHAILFISLWPDEVEPLDGVDATLEIFVEDADGRRSNTVERHVTLSTERLDMH